MKTTIQLVATSAIVLFTCVSLGLADQSSRDNVQPAAEVEPAKSLPSIGFVSENKNDPSVTRSDATPVYDAAQGPSENGGDINLNGVPNEVADAVLYTKYFIYGLQVFCIDQQAQIMETDTNADGLRLTVGDLVYQIRIIEE